MREESSQATAVHRAVPTSQYTYEQLAEIYNQARVDYIVPMPMNARRMREYAENYDLSLDASMVAIDREDEEVNGICMLGIRGQRTWITRLGVIPERRRKHAGQFLMEVMLEESRRREKALVQLEVIKGNEPAYRLFTKLGFELTRELLIIRRAPGALKPADRPVTGSIIVPIEEQEIPEVLEGREPGASWVEETASLLNAGHLTGFRVTMPSGEMGWIVCQRTPLQLAHFVLKPGCSFDMNRTLIAAVHANYPMQDTKIENVPLDHPTWPAFEALGYVIAFRRIEMVLTL